MCVTEDCIYAFRGRVNALSCNLGMPAAEAGQRFFSNYSSQQNEKVLRHAKYELTAFAIDVDALAVAFSVLMTSSA